MLGHGVGAEQREGQRLVHVPRELVAAGDRVDLLVVVDRVELLDPALPVVARESGTASPHRDSIAVTVVTGKVTSARSRTTVGTTRPGAGRRA